MKKIIVIMVSLYMVFGCYKNSKEQTVNYNENDPNKISSSITGIWQINLPVMSVDWFETYQFFADGRFIHNKNQIDHTERINSYSGTYSISNSEIKITKLEKTIIMGGEIMGPKSHEFIEGGEITTVKYNPSEINTFRFIPPERFNLSLSESEWYTYKIIINGETYFKMRNDPKDFP